MSKRLQSYSTKRLQAQVDPPNTAIGRRIADLIPAGARKISSGERPTFRNPPIKVIVDAFDLNGDSKADAWLETTLVQGSSPSSLDKIDRVTLRVVAPGDQRNHMYFAGETQIIDSVCDSRKDRLGETWFYDSNKDGRLDYMTTSGSDMGVFTAEGHSGTPVELSENGGVREIVLTGSPPVQIKARGLEDTDRDGKFDTEHLGGPWWLKDS